MSIEINGTTVNLHAATYRKIAKIAKERKITIPEAITYCLEKVK